MLEPKVYDNVLNEDIISKLKKLAFAPPLEFKKNKIICARREPALEIDEVMKFLNEIGYSDVTGGNFFHSPIPYQPHADTDNLKNTTNGAIIVFPIAIDGPSEVTTHTIVMHQRWTKFSCNFVKGYDQKWRTEYNKSVFDYSEVIGYTNKPWNGRKLSHCTDEQLFGFSEWTALPWKIGSAIVFPRSCIHSAENFLEQGIRSKTALSIFTSKE